MEKRIQDLLGPRMFIIQKSKSQLSAWDRLKPQWVQHAFQAPAVNQNAITKHYFK